MYRTNEEYVRGQKIKLIIAFTLVAIAFIAEHFLIKN